MLRKAFVIWIANSGDRALLTFHYRDTKIDKGVRTRGGLPTAKKSKNVAQPSWISVSAGTEADGSQPSS